MTGDMYTCVSVTGNFTRHTHNTSFFKVPYHKSVKQKKMTYSALGRMQRLDDLCLLLSTDMDPADGQNSMLDSGGSQQKGAGSVFQGGGSES